MRKFLVLSLFIVANSYSLWAQAQTDNPSSDSELAAVSARGRAIAAYDAAAWHSTDAVVPLNPSGDTVKLYIARKTENGWVVMWGRFNELKTKFLIAYEAREGDSPTEYKVVQHDPPMEDGDVYLRAAKAHELAAADFRNREHPQIPYNISVLPGPSAGWYVYFIPSQTENDALPYGADVRYTVSASGEAIMERRQMHEILQESSTDKTLLGIHSHTLSDTPEDSDVFYAMTLNFAQGDWIIGRTRVYGISSDGSINHLGRIEDVVKMLKAGRFTEVVEPYRSMVESHLERGTPPDSLEAFLSLSGARCDRNTLLLKFSIILNNSTGSRMILNRRALWNAQVRFGVTSADILAGKYEKIVIMAPDKTNYSDDREFIFLGPGMVYHQDREYPVLGANLDGKAAIQFLFFTWPLMEDDQIDAQRARWAKVGYLYTSDIVTPPTPLKFDPKLLTVCRTE